MTLVEQYEQRLGAGGSIVPFVKTMAAALDGVIKDVSERGFSALDLVTPADTKTWVRAMDAVNGQGDVMNRLRAMCAALDRLSDWVALQGAIPAEDAAVSSVDAAKKAAIADRMAKARAARGKSA